MTDTDKLAALDAKARDAMAAANLAAENRAGPDIMQTLMSENALAHERLAHELVNAYRANALVPRAEMEEAVRKFAQSILHGDETHRAWLLNEAETFLARHTQEAERG